MILLGLWPDSVPAHNELLSSEHLIDLSTFSQSSQCNGFLATDIQELLNKIGWDPSDLVQQHIIKCQLDRKFCSGFCLPTDQDLYAFRGCGEALMGWSHREPSLHGWNSRKLSDRLTSLVIYQASSEVPTFSSGLRCLLSSWRIFQSHHQLSSDQHQQSCLLSSQN